MEFPRYVFKSPGKHSLGKGQSYGCALVANLRELDEMLASGWFQSIPEAVAPLPITSSSDPIEVPPTRAELETKATQLGIKFDGRMGDKKLGALILERLEA